MKPASAFSNRQIIDYKSKIKSINAKLSRLKDLYIDGLIFLDTYAAMPKVKKRELWQMLLYSIEIPNFAASILFSSYGLPAPDFSLQFLQIP